MPKSYTLGIGTNTVVIGAAVSSLAILGVGIAVALWPISSNISQDFQTQHDVEKSSSDISVSLSDQTPLTNIVELSLDVVRIDPTGSALVAGRADPESTVRVMIDEAVAFETQSDTGGNFVAMFQIDTLQAPRLLTSAQQHTDGTWHKGLDQIIVAPMTSPRTLPAQPKKISAAVSSAPQTPADIQQSDNDISIFVETPNRLPELNSGDDAPPERPKLVRLSENGGAQRIDLATPDRLSLETISYNNVGEVILSGVRKNIRADQIRVYMNDTPVSLAEIPSNGEWSIALEDIETGIYTLRIDEIDQSNRVVSRIETPFERTSPDILRALHSTDLEQPLSVITVQPGFTLWGIAEDRFGDGFRYVQVFEENKHLIRNPDLIYPGQVFALPDDDQPSE